MSSSVEEASCRAVSGFQGARQSWFGRYSRSVATRTLVLAVQVFQEFFQQEKMNQKKVAF